MALVEMCGTGACIVTCKLDLAVGRASLHNIFFAFIP